MLAGVLTVGATYGLGRRVAGSRAAFAAAALMALSPFAILFSPTAFTDGWLTFFIVAAAWAAVAGRPGLAGVLLGLACASKQQGVLAAPLVAGLVIAGLKPSRSVRRTLGALGLAALGFAVVFGAVTYWDSLRWHNRPSYWDQSLRTYGGVVLAPLADWPARAAAWARQAGYWFGAWPITLTLLAAASLGWLSPRPSENERIGRRMNESTARDSFIRALGAGHKAGRKEHSLVRARLRPDVVCGAYAAGYLLVHVVFTIQPWDRYLLPILPLVCVLTGRGLAAGWAALGRPRAGRIRHWAAAGLAAGLIFAATLGARAAIPVGSDIGAYRGVAEAARFLARQPAGSTVYFDRIGWHLGYYLYGLPIARSWYDSPQKLASETVRVAAEHAGVAHAGVAHAEAAQWLALPEWERARLPVLRSALASAGFSAWPAYEVEGANGAVDVTIYRLERTALAAGPGEEP